MHAKNIQKLGQIKSERTRKNMKDARKKSSEQLGERECKKSSIVLGESIKETQQGTMHKARKKRIGYKVPFKYAKTYTRQVAKNYAGKHATEVARKQARNYA